MLQLTTTKIRNGMLTLPREIAIQWQGRELSMLFENNRLVAQPLDAEWDEYEERLKKVKKKISPRLVDDAVQWAKRQTR